MAGEAEDEGSNQNIQEHPPEGACRCQPIQVMLQHSWPIKSPKTAHWCGKKKEQKKKKISNCLRP